MLHEYVPAVDPAEVRAALGVTATAAQAERAGADEQAEAEPANVEASDHVPDAASENFRPDRLTALDSGLDYFEVFDPSIAPFKRVMSLDATRLDVDGKTPVLGVHDPRRRIVPIEPSSATDPDARPRDRFSAEVDLDFHDDSVQRLPSVSPESRIFELHTSPQLALRIERDAADNYFARALGKPPDKPVHVRYVMDAPRAYFGTQIPRLPLRSLAREVPPLPASVTRRALRFAAQLGITQRSDLRGALEALTQHFRGFVESDSPPDNTGDLYLDLARGGKGLCRHRAYGFVVTAQALGIVAHFVQNEAHSFVEVKLPGSGFLRIDLGGAAHGLTAHSTRTRPNYMPAQPDTLPRPKSYRDSYAQAQIDNANQAGHAQGAATRAADAAANLSTVQGRWIPARDLAAPTSRNPDQPGTDAERAAGSPATSKLPLLISLDDRRVTALRGGKLVMTGRLSDEHGAGVAELRVEVWIVRDRTRERMLLGVGVTDADGYFRISFAVPADLDVGDYRLVVGSEGDATHLPVTTD